MPEMDGFEATRKIRELEQAKGRKRIPIIAMTAHAMEGDRNLCLQAGMDDYMSKPINPDKLHQVLYQWLLKDENNDVIVAGNDLQQEASQNSDIEEVIIDLSLLEAFTEGNLNDEKMFSDAFLSGGEGCLKIMQDYIIKGEKTDKDWNGAVHKLKGSSAQIGANRLSTLCFNAEKGSSDLTLEEQKTLLAELEIGFAKVKAFFESRQA